MRGLSLVAASRGHSSLRCAGLSLSWPLFAEHRLQTRRLSNCGSRAQLLHGMWDLPRPGLEPVSPALAGGFSTTAPPGKPSKFFINLFIFYFCFWLHRVFVAARGLSLVAASGGYSSLRCVGFSLRWLLLLQSMGSRRTGFSSCGMWAQYLWRSSSRAQAQ